MMKKKELTFNLEGISLEDYMYSQYKDIQFEFDAQIQKYYYDLHKADYELVSVHNNEFIPYKKETMNTDNLIIYDDAKSGLNDIGENKYALSKSWYKTRKYSLRKWEHFSVSTKNMVLFTLKIFNRLCFKIFIDDFLMTFWAKKVIFFL